MDLSKKDLELLINLNTEELDSVQIRLIKSMNALMTQLLTAEDEAEYFELSAALVKKSSEVIKASNFSKSKNPHIAKQALEFAFDFFQDGIIDDENGNVDN